MSTTIEVLMIDDDKDNYDSLKNYAAAQRIRLRYAKSLDLGIDQLSTNKSLLAVILDGKGFLKSDQEKGSESANFVHQALTEIAILEKEQDRFIPKCVLTAWYEQLEESLNGRVDVFDKKKIALDDELKKMMFSTLKDKVINSKEYKIRHTHSSLFEVVKKSMTPSIDASLYNILEAAESNKCEKNDFVLVRDVFEAVLKALSRSEIRLIPDNLFKPDGRPNLEYCVRYLKGLNINDRGVELYPKLSSSRVPEHIANSIDFVKGTSSALSHDYQKNFTAYSFKATVFAMAEILIWLKAQHASTPV